jgi:hypothetical protein
MKRVILAIVCVALCAFTSRLAPTAPADKQALIVVQGPILVAFFEPVTPAQLEKDPDANEALDDFQYYAANIREPLKKMGVEFHELYAHSFRLRVGNKLTTFRPGKETVGYYLLAPGKKPQIEYGVMTDADLLKLAREYFGLSGK